MTETTIERIIPSNATKEQAGEFPPFKEMVELFKTTLLELGLKEWGLKFKASIEFGLPTLGSFKLEAEIWIKGEF